MKKVLYTVLGIFSYQLLGVKSFFVTIKPSSSEFIFFNNSKVFQHACLTPLTTANCLLERLTQEENNITRKQLILDTQCAIERLSLLISSLSQGFQSAHFSIRNALQEVITLTKVSKSNFITCHYSFDTDILLHGNKTYFQEIFVCLLNNALEAYGQTDAKPILVFVQIVNDKICIHVVDFACGMNLWAQKLAVLRGVSFKQKGHGLGLSFVKKALSYFKGEIKIISQFGVGTHVCVRIPLNQTDSQILLQS